MAIVRIEAESVSGSQGSNVGFSSGNGVSAGFVGFVGSKHSLCTEAANNGQNKQLARRWRWFLSLAREHGISPLVAAAEFPALQDRLDTVEPAEHTDDVLRANQSAHVARIEQKGYITL